MIDLLVAGNLVFTLPLTVVAIAVLWMGIQGAIAGGPGREDAFSPERLLFHLGLFAFVFGLLSQTISLYQMMGAIEAAGAVSPAIVAGGLKVSFIAPLYGLFIFVAALLLRFGLGLRTSRTAV